MSASDMLDITNMADSSFAIQNGNLLESEKYTDMTIKCGGDTFKVHRSVVCLQSPYFTAAMDGGFREAENCEIDLVEEERDNVRRMIRFLYVHDYDDDRSSAIDPDSDEGPLLVNANMYIVGDKYNIPSLKKHAVSKFKEVVDEHWNRPSFSASIAYLYENSIDTDRALKDVIMEVVGTNIRALLQKKEDGTSYHFKELLEYNETVAAEVIELMKGKSRHMAPVDSLDEWQNIMLTVPSPPSSPQSWAEYYDECDGPGYDEYDDSSYARSYGGGHEGSSNRQYYGNGARVSHWYSNPALGRWNNNTQNNSSAGSQNYGHGQTYGTYTGTAAPQNTPNGQNYAPAPPQINSNGQSYGSAPIQSNGSSQNYATATLRSSSSAQNNSSAPPSNNHAHRSNEDGYDSNWRSRGPRGRRHISPGWSSESSDEMVVSRRRNGCATQQWCASNAPAQ